ncbi:MAG: DUF6838 family protein [Romboutsia timonensis]
MNIEVTENIIRGSIIYQLKQFFGDSYKYYDEEIEQGFQKPSFHVSRIDGISRKGYTGNEYKLVDNTYRYVIKYFTAEENNKIGDINNKIDELKQIFNYLELVNFKDNKVYSKLSRINDITVTVSDGVLLFQISFPLQTVEYVKVDKVKSNTLEEHIINNEKEEK